MLQLKLRIRRDQRIAPITKRVAITCREHDSQCKQSREISIERRCGAQILNMNYFQHTHLMNVQFPKRGSTPIDKRNFSKLGRANPLVSVSATISDVGT